MIRVVVIFIIFLVCKTFYRHKVYGLEHLNTAPGEIIAPNHVSFLDPPIIGTSCPYELHFLAKESLFKKPFFGWFIRQLNTHPVAKSGGSLASIRMACEFIESGKKIAIFPEGTRSSSGEFKEPQLGIGLLVLRTKCRVVPTYIHGSYDIWPTSRKFPKLKGRTVCVFGSPLQFSFDENTDRKQLQTQIAQTVMQKIAELKQWYLDGAKGSPP